MQLEFHQLDRRWEHLRVRHPARQRRLLASLAEAGQQTPIVVVEAEGQADRYVVIDGYKRIVALEQLGRDTVGAVVWPMSEAAAVLLDRSLRLSEHETALEVGWLLAELERRFNYGLDELARRFDRSVSWVSRRLALVEVLPESIQQQVREGTRAKRTKNESHSFCAALWTSERPLRIRTLGRPGVSWRADIKSSGSCDFAWIPRSRQINASGERSRDVELRHSSRHSNVLRSSSTIQSPDQHDVDLTAARGFQ